MAAVTALLFLAASWVPAAQAQTVARISVSATASPATPVPGTSGSVQIALTNVGNATAYGLEMRLKSLDAGVQINRTERVTVGALGALDSTTVAPYTYWVPLSTPSGVYRADFHLTYSYSSGSSVVYSDLDFSVVFAVQSPPALLLGPLSPYEIVPGQHNVLNLTMRNTAPATITSLSGSWTDTTKTLSPLGAGNRLFLTDLLSGESRTLPVELAAKSGAAAGIYQLEFTFTYNDAAGTSHSLATTFAIHVHAPPKLSVALDEWQSDSITLAVSNIGLGPATAVEVRLVAGGPVRARPAAAVFLGNLDPGDHTTATFSPAHADGGRGAALEVEVAFTDPDGERRVEVQSLDVGEPPDDGDGVAAPIAWTSAAVLAAGAAGGAWYWRRRRRGAA